MTEPTRRTVRRVTVVTNPAAGRGLEAADPALERLRERGVELAVVRADSAAGSERAARDAVARGTDAVVAVGGDGLVSLLLGAVAATGVPLGIVPIGTGNDLARALRIPLRDPAAAADVVADAFTRDIDLGRVGERHFATVLASGFDSLVTDRANRMRRPRGRLRYYLAMLAELGRLGPIDYRIELDGTVVETAAALVSVGNSDSYGGGMRICPDARIDDGLLDVTVVRSGGRLRLIRLFPTVYRGTHVRLPEVHTYRAARVRLSTPNQPITAYADGEPLAPLPITIDVAARACRVLVPH